MIDLSGNKYSVEEFFIDTPYIVITIISIILNISNILREIDIWVKIICSLIVLLTPIIMIYYMVKINILENNYICSYRFKIFSHEEESFPFKKRKKIGLDDVDEIEKIGIFQYLYQKYGIWIPKKLRKRVLKSKLSVSKKGESRLVTNKSVVVSESFYQEVKEDIIVSKI